MKDSPLFLLVPTLLIIGVVGWMFVGERSSVETREVLDIATTTDPTVASTTDKQEINEEIKSDPENLLNIFKQKEEGEKWTGRNLLMSEPCDFLEIEKFADELLAKPEWAEVVKQYPNRMYTPKKESPLDVLVASKWLYGCHLEVVLSSKKLSQSEFEDWGKKSDPLSLINSTQNYQGASLRFNLDEIPIIFLLADGYARSSFGTYQHNSQADIVRLFSVTDYFTSNYSAYEASDLGVDMCPCVQNFRFRITNEISVEDIQRALEEKKLPEDWVPEE